MKLIIERIGQLSKQFRPKGTVTKENHDEHLYGKWYTMKQDMLNSQIHLTDQLSTEGVCPRAKRSCVIYVCPILNLWIIISSRRGKRNIKMFSVSECLRSCHCLAPKYVWLICNLNEKQSSKTLGVEQLSIIRRRFTCQSNVTK